MVMQLRTAQSYLKAVGSPFVGLMLVNSCVLSINNYNLIAYHKFMHKAP